MPALAVTEREAAQFSDQGQWGKAVRAWELLVGSNPKSVPIRLGYADALMKHRDWERAAAEYERVLELDPRNAEAMRNLGTLRRWQGRLEEARAAYERAAAFAPNDPAPALGLAATDRLDHNFDAAQARYDVARQKWPRDEDVRGAAYDFARERNPKVYVFFEDDLSFETRQVGVGVPFLSREEIGFEHQKETRLQYQTGTKTYDRTDNKVLFAHYFGYNRTLDASARSAKYRYVQAPTSYSAIDTFEEFRVRYSHPITWQHTGVGRYSMRPTKLLTTGDKFTAHKLEAEVVSQWTPRVQTGLGAGRLRDLDENATSTAGLRNTGLTKITVQVDFTDRIQGSAKYITNPDLDDSIKDTRIVQGDYTFTGTISGLARYRADDYKQGDDQSSLYVGVRFVPNSHLWSEFGLKRGSRGSYHSTDPLVSVVYRF